MDEVYRARLSAEPPGPSAGKAPQPHPDDIHIQSHPVNPPGGFPNSGQPVPIQLPNIYVNPFPSGTAHHESLHRNDDHDGTIHRNGPINVPSISHRKSHSIKIGPFRFAKPHPLLWVCLFLSVLALVLEVPRGSLPTLTGRHKSLRAKEKLLDQKMHLLAHLSHFLPPPLSTLIEPGQHADPTSSLLALTDRHHLELIHNAGLRFWNSHLGTSIVGAGDHDRWWAVEELGEGASLVRSKSEGKEREVWVLRMGESDDRERPLINALTQSLLIRDRLQSELEASRTSDRGSGLATITPGDHRATDRSSHTDDRGRRQHEEAARLEQHMRDREREKEVEEREREVTRREKWVVEEMRKLSDKVHAQATELTLEDRITERLKSYQRQLARLDDNPTGPSAQGTSTAKGFSESRGHPAGRAEL